MRSEVDAVEEWMTSDEAKLALRVSAVTLWRLRRAGRLTVFKLPGGGLRYREQDLANVLKEESVTTT